MFLILIIDTKAVAAAYMEWQWTETDLVAGYMKKLSLYANGRSLLGMVIPEIGYLEYTDTGFGEIKDPSYDRYLDVEGMESTVEASDQSETEKTLQTEEISAQSIQESAAERLAVQTSAPAAYFSKSDLLDFNTLIEKNYTVTSITQLKPEMFDVEEALDMDLSMKQDNNSPQILIFHTHSQEGFADSIEADASTTIVGVGEYLAELLREQYGYQVIHDTGVYDLVDGKLDRSAAYTYAEKGVESILEKYPSIEVVIDLHRDGVDDANRLVTTVNGKPTAKVMFFNGISYTKVNGALSYLPNPYIEENLAMSLQMKLLGDAYYPGFLRKNYIHGYRYCLHYRAKSMLIEAGAQNNTLEEERNAMEPLAEILHRLLSGEQAYK
jgi:stage II sporulation protein P